MRYLKINLDLFYIIMEKSVVDTKSIIVNNINSLFNELEQFSKELDSKYKNMNEMKEDIDQKHQDINSFKKVSFDI